MTVDKVKVLFLAFAADKESNRLGALYNVLPIEFVTCNEMRMMLSVVLVLVTSSDLDLTSKFDSSVHLAMGKKCFYLFLFTYFGSKCYSFSYLLNTK